MTENYFDVYYRSIETIFEWPVKNAEMNDTNVILLDSVTDANPDSAGKILVCGSHGGLYTAYVASQANARAVILNDAGVGLDGAGTRGVMALADVGMAAATAKYTSCRIGSSMDVWENGQVSVVNSVAADLALSPGMTVKQAVKQLALAIKPLGAMAEIQESRSLYKLAGAGPNLLLVDSASLVTPDDAGKIIISGSHGGLIGNDPLRALKARAAVAVFNDAGGGKDQAGLSRLPALDNTGVAAVTVAHTTARIGDARSTIDTGVISHCNKLATEQGAEVNMLLSEWIVRRQQQLN